MLMVTLVNSDGHKVAHRLEAGQVLVVGRGSDADIRLVDASVSRVHAEFLEDAEGRWCVRDVGSANHTFRNGLQVEAARVFEGDAIRFGDFTVKIESAAHEPQFQWSPSGRGRDPKVTD